MTGGPYKYDVGDLTDTASGLATLKGDYESATSDREAASGSFGFEEISGAVEEFVSSWSDKRKEQIADLESAHQGLTGIIDNYTQLDAERRLAGQRRSVMSWEPLAGENPLPGEPGEIDSYARGLTATAHLIAEQVGMLRKLADPANWVAETADAFRAQAQDLGEKITKAEDRYRTVGSELSAWSDELADAQRRAGILLTDAQQAQRVADANPMPVAAPDPTGVGAPELTPAQEQQRTAGMHAAEEVDRLRGQLDSLVGTARETAWEHGRRIRASLDDVLGNSFWDKIQAFISNYADVLREVAKWAGRVALVLGAIALVIALLSNPAGWVVLIGSLATVGAAMATGVSLVANSGLATSGNGDGKAVAFDAVALLTFGVGRWATKGASAALATSTSRGARIAGTSASDAALAQKPMRLATARFLARDRVPRILRSRAADYLTGRAHTAAIADNLARDVVRTAPATSFISRLLHGKTSSVTRAHAGQTMAQFPDVASVTAPALSAVRFANINTASLAVADLSNTVKTVVSDPSLDRASSQLKTVVGRLVQAR